MLSIASATVVSGIAAEDPTSVGPATEETAESGSGFLDWLLESGAFHSPSINEFFPAPILFEGTIFQFDRVTMIRVLMAIVMVVLFGIVASRAKVVPGRAQAAVELVLDFVRVQIVEEVMGKENARRFVPFLTTLFIAIIFFNISGVLPFLNIAATSLIGLPLVMALWVYFLYLGVGVRTHGLGKYLRNSLFPPGVPWPIYILLTPIEFLQVFVLRPATLALRLTANMMAGHLLLVLCFAGTHFFFLEAQGWQYLTGAGTLLAGLMFTLFEIFVALLQAYVFVMLSTVYLNMALEEEH